MRNHTKRLEEALAAFQSGEKSNAVDIWSALADEGNAEAAWSLGYLHYTGEINDDGLPDFEKAASFFSQAAVKGHCLACNALGNLLYFGVGIEKDKSAARRWFESAASHGDDDAATSLGFLYETGSGGEENLEASIRWYTHAAEHGNVEAQYRLGLANLTGRGTPQNAVQGFYWLVKASEQGHLSARISRDELLPFIDDDIAKRVAELTLEKSAVLH